MSLFQPAERTRVPLKVAIAGPSGSGKTFSALAIAAGMAKGGKVAVIDSENGSASLYSEKFKFDTAVIRPPYTVEKFLAALREAEAAGYAVVILDSISHEWAGTGGILQKKSDIDATGGNSYTNWRGPGKEHDSFIATLIESPLDLIATMRSKTEYVLELNEKGKQAPKKVGMAPVQREGVEFEFSVMLDLSGEHMATVSKDRTGVLDGQVFKPVPAIGKSLVDWRDSGKEWVKPPVAVAAGANIDFTFHTQGTMTTGPHLPIQAAPQPPERATEASTEPPMDQIAGGSAAYKSCLQKFKKCADMQDLKGARGFYRLREKELSEDEKADLKNIDRTYEEQFK